MRKFLSASLLFSLAMPALAEANPIPEPETLSLLAVGVIGLMLARRSK
jgi:hypothetical protein